MPFGSSPPSLADVLAPGIARDAAARARDESARVANYSNDLRKLPVGQALRRVLMSPPPYTRTDAEAVRVVTNIHAGRTIDDVQFRGLCKLLRTWDVSFEARTLLEGFLATAYPQTGPFLYPGDIDEREGTPLIGSHQCAALVQSTIPAIGLAKTWRQGIRVRGNGHLIRKGTAIATFEDGIYPNRDHGNHVAYYLGQSAAGVRIMDQWIKKEAISSRTVAFLGQDRFRSYVNSSNNGDAFFVIMKPR